MSGVSVVVVSDDDDDVYDASHDSSLPALIP